MTNVAGCRVCVRHPSRTASTHLSRLRKITGPALALAGHLGGIMAMEQLDAAAVRECLGLGDDHQAWLDELAALDVPKEGLCLPRIEDAPALLALLAITPADAAVVLDHWPSPTRSPAAWWLLERCCHRLARSRGGIDPISPWPSLPPNLGPFGRCFYVYVFLAALAGIRRWHQQHVIPDDVAWATLADLGRHMAIYHRVHGVTGLDSQNWLTRHFRGTIFALGRLQYERARVWYDPATLERLGAPFAQGDPALAIHIPEAGPLALADCEASLQWARDFFAQHFPTEPYRIATCTSWLLDDQLADYLGPETNIVRFQRQFHLIPGVERDGDEAIIRFVFRQADMTIDGLPQRTTLERAIVAHLRAGHHWRVRSGWLEL